MNWEKLLKNIPDIENIISAYNPERRKKEIAEQVPLQTGAKYLSNRLTDHTLVDPAIRNPKVEEVLDQTMATAPVLSTLTKNLGITHIVTSGETEEVVGVPDDKVFEEGGKFFGKYGLAVSETNIDGQFVGKDFLAEVIAHEGFGHGLSEGLAIQLERVREPLFKELQNALKQDILSMDMRGWQALKKSGQPTLEAWAEADTIHDLSGKGHNTLVATFDDRLKFSDDFTPDPFTTTSFLRDILKEAQNSGQPLQDVEKQFPNFMRVWSQNEQLLNVGMYISTLPPFEAAYKKDLAYIKREGFLGAGAVLRDKYGAGKRADHYLPKQDFGGEHPSMLLAREEAFAEVMSEQILGRSGPETLSYYMPSMVKEVNQLRTVLYEIGNTQKVVENAASLKQVSQKAKDTGISEAENCPPGQEWIVASNRSACIYTKDALAKAREAGL